MGYRQTKHSAQRMQQRGIQLSQVRQLVALADLDVGVDRGLSAIRLSRAALREAVADGLRPSEAEKLIGRVLIVSEGGSLVTVAHMTGKKSAAYRRRNRPAFWR